MLSGIFVLVVTALLSFAIVNGLTLTGSPTNTFLKRLFFFHTFMALVYFWYASFNPSDSKGYYLTTLNFFSGPDWGDFYGVSTTFIKFIGYPFIHFLGFGYEAMMALFAWFGYLGFVFFYIVFRERIRFGHSFLGMDLLTLIFYLPNLHFWSSSFGKGSVIFLGFALFVYGISHLPTRYLYALLGGVLIYHIRPHIMLVVLLSYGGAFIFSTRGVSFFWRVAFVAMAAVAFTYIYKDVLTLVGIDEEQFVEQGLNLTHRAKELSKATTGVDITSYSLPMQVFTFLYRPLFFDAPGILGLIVSVENVFYLLITLRLITNFRAWHFVLSADYLVKGALFSFVTVSIALAQVAGNLGLAMRQKSQVMILFMFVLLAFLDSEKQRQWEAFQMRRKREAVRRGNLKMGI
jgi:hypothetical protein